MRKIFLIISLFIVSVFYGQNIDVFSQLKKLEANKKEYVGKPFSVLLKAMGEVQPTRVSSSAGRYLYWVTMSNFGFSDHNVIVYVKWEHKKVSREKANYYSKKNNWTFTKEEREFYSDKIIEDISVYDRRYLK